MRALLIIFLAMFALCSCSGNGKANTELFAQESAYPVSTTTAIPSSTLSLTPSPTAALPTPSEEPVDKLAFLHSISPELRAMIVEDYPWRHENHTELLFNHTEYIPPYIHPIVNNDKPHFSGDDMVAGELHYYMPLQDVVELMGLPRAIYSYIMDATGEHWLALYYADGNELSFCNAYEPDKVYRLIDARIPTDLPGPRGIQVGDSMDAVLQSFKVDPPDLGENIDMPGCMTLYAEYMIDDYTPNAVRPLAPSGAIESSDYFHWHDPEEAKTYIRYHCPVHPYTMEEVESGEKEYPFLAMYYLSFVIQDGKVIEYYWAMGMAAE